jgi:hypothetical protein
LCTLLFMIGPVVQLLGIAAMRAQARETRSRGSAGALSVQSLVIQAVIFLLVGISFAFRLKPPAEALNEHFIVNVREWYWLVGGRRSIMLYSHWLKGGWRGSCRVWETATTGSVTLCWRRQDSVHIVSPKHVNENRKTGSPAYLNNNNNRISQGPPRASRPATQLSSTLQETCRLRDILSSASIIRLPNIHLDIYEPTLSSQFGCFPIHLINHAIELQRARVPKTAKLINQVF